VVLANNFNQSLNLKRMKMMKKKRSTRFARMMSLMAMPVLVGVALFASGNFVNANNDESGKKSIQEIVVVAKKGNAVPQKAVGNYEPVVVKEESKVEGPVFKIVENMPKFPGGDKELMQFLRTNVKYPAKAHEKGIQGRVYVEFIVTKSGKVENAKISKGVHPLLDNEALRTINAMPNWEPGKQKGKAVNVSYRLPINFVLQ
jgi:TonB family protein